MVMIRKKNNEVKNRLVDSRTMSEGFGQFKGSTGPYQVEFVGTVEKLPIKLILERIELQP